MSDRCNRCLFNGGRLINKCMGCVDAAVAHEVVRDFGLPMDEESVMHRARGRIHEDRDARSPTTGGELPPVCPVERLIRLYESLSTQNAIDGTDVSAQIADEASQAREEWTRLQTAKRFQGAAIVMLEALGSDMLVDTDELQSMLDAAQKVPSDG